MGNHQELHGFQSKKLCFTGHAIFVPTFKLHGKNPIMLCFIFRNWKTRCARERALTGLMSLAMSDGPSRTKIHKLCIGEVEEWFYMSVDANDIELSHADWAAWNQNHLRHLSRETEALLWIDKKKNIRSLTEDVGCYLCAKFLRPVYQALRKLYCKALSQVLALRTAACWFLQDMSKETGSLVYVQQRS